MKGAWRRAVAISAAMNVAAVLWLGWVQPVAGTAPAVPPVTVYFAAAAEQAAPARSGRASQSAAVPVVAENKEAATDLAAAPAAEPRPASGPPAGGAARQNPEAGTTAQNKGYVPARVLNRVEPVYPEAARRRGAAGRVRVRAMVSAAGAVEECMVVASSGYADLDAAAAEAVRRWRFAPTVDRDSGRAVSSYVTVPVVFELR